MNDFGFMDDSGQDPRVDRAQAEDGTNSTATGVAADNAAAGATALTHSEGTQSQTPAKGRRTERKKRTSGARTVQAINSDRGT